VCGNRVGKEAGTEMWEVFNAMLKSLKIFYRQSKDNQGFLGKWWIWNFDDDMKFYKYQAGFWHA
jgi:hypothetical protein